MPLARGRGVVMYEDGTEERFETSINAIAEYERYAVRTAYRWAPMRHR